MVCTLSPPRRLDLEAEPPTACFFNGKLDEISLFSSTLSASDIATLYNSGVPGDVSSLNPVGWWRMGDNNGGSGTTITDQGSGSNNGTLTNGPAFSSDVPPSPPSFSTLSADLDGSDDYMTCGSVTQINSVTNLSTSSWFKINAYQGGGGPLILGGQSVAGSNGFYLQALDATTLRYAHQDYGSYNNFTSLSVPINTWHNVVTVQAGTDLTVYLNGSSVGTATVTAVDSGWGSNFTIGKWSGGNFNYMNGIIDEVALFTSALSASDVSSIYNSGQPADLTSYSPVGWWRMGDGTGDTDSGGGTPANTDTIGTVVDQGSGGNNATAANGPTYSSTTP